MDSSPRSGGQGMASLVPKASGAARRWSCGVCRGRPDMLIRGKIRQWSLPPVIARRRPPRHEVMKAARGHSRDVDVASPEDRPAGFPAPRLRRSIASAARFARNGSLHSRRTPFETRGTDTALQVPTHRPDSGSAGVGALGGTVRPPAPTRPRRSWARVAPQSREIEFRHDVNACVQGRVRRIWVRHFTRHGSQP